MHKDMGNKEKPIETDSAVASEQKEPRIHYPVFSISGDRIIEELANAKVGDMCRLEIVVKKVADSIDGYDKEPRVELEVHKMGYLAKAGKKNFEEYDKMNEEEKEKYDKEDIEDKEDKE